MAITISFITLIATFLLATLATLLGNPSFAFADAVPSGSDAQLSHPSMRPKQPEAYQERFIEWVSEDPDGFFHPSILWQRLGPDRTSGPYAMHATEDIPKGTPLIVLPRKYFIESRTGKEMDTPEDDQRYDYRNCYTVEMMLEEYFQHIDETTTFQSFYAPYLTYLFEDVVGGTTRGLLPETWSKHSLEIMDLILGPQDQEGYTLRPAVIGSYDIFEICLGQGQEDEENEDGDSHGSSGAEEEEDEAKDDDNGDAEKDMEEDATSEDTKDDHEHQSESDGKGDDQNQSDENISEEESLTEEGSEEEDSNDNNVLEEDYSNENHFATKRLAQDALLFLLSRGWNDKLLPVVDMFNHRNGHWRNVEVTTVEEWEDEDSNGAAAYAWRDIKKGEQLQISYSECIDATCGFGTSKYSANTQFLFDEYGFVELYPRRWVFDADSEELCAEVDEDSAGGVTFQWIINTPTEKDIQWIREQLTRLKSIESRVQEGLEQLEEVLLREGEGLTIHNFEHERDTILEYYEAYIEVLELALEHKDDPVGVTEDMYDEEMEAIAIAIENNGIPTIQDIKNHELLSSRPSHKDESTSDGGDNNMGGEL